MPDLASVERHLGAQTAALEALTRAVDRLAEKFDSHLEQDNLRFLAIEVRLAEDAAAQRSEDAAEEKAERTRLRARGRMHAFLVQLVPPAASALLTAIGVHFWAK